MNILVTESNFNCYDVKIIIESENSDEVHMAEGCKKFLLLNGYHQAEEDEFENCTTFVKNNLSDVQICEDEIVFLNDNGDFLHLPLNYFALVGALMEFRQIGMGYISAPQKEGEQ